MIKRLREVLPYGQLSAVGEALINSKIRYGTAVYGSVRLSVEDPKIYEMHRLQVLQNSLMRIVLGKRRTDHISVESLLQSTGYLSVNRLAAYHTLLEMFSIVKFVSIPNISAEFQESKMTSMQLGIVNKVV